MDRLHVNFDNWSFKNKNKIYFFYAARIGYTFGCHYYPTNLNSLGHCICVHQGNISAAAGLEPGTPGLWVSHATNGLSWRHRITFTIVKVLVQNKEAVIDDNSSPSILKGVSATLQSGRYTLSYPRGRIMQVNLVFKLLFISLWIITFVIVVIHCNKCISVFLSSFSIKNDLINLLPLKNTCLWTFFLLIDFWQAKFRENARNFTSEMMWVPCLNVCTTR